MCVFIHSRVKTFPHGCELCQGIENFSVGYFFFFRGGERLIILFFLSVGHREFCGVLWSGLLLEMLGLVSMFELAGLA